MEPKDDLIAASVQNILKLPSTPATVRTNGNLPTGRSAPEPAPRRHSGFLAASSNLPSANGSARNNAVPAEVGGTRGARSSPRPSQGVALASDHRYVDSLPVAQTTASPMFPHGSMAPITAQAPLVIQAGSFPAAPPPMRALYPSGYIDQVGDIYSGSLLHHQIPLMHKCQTYVESVSASRQAPALSTASSFTDKWKTSHPVPLSLVKWLVALVGLVRSTSPHLFDEGEFGLPFGVLLPKFGCIANASLLYLVILPPPIGGNAAVHQLNVIDLSIAWMTRRYWTADVLPSPHGLFRLFMQLPTASPAPPAVPDFVLHADPVELRRGSGPHADEVSRTSTEPQPQKPAKLGGANGVDDVPGGLAREVGRYAFRARNSPKISGPASTSRSLESMENIFGSIAISVLPKDDPYTNMSPPSSAPSSPVADRPPRRRKGPTSTGAPDRGERSSSQRKPPWNAHTPQHAYVKNTDRDPNMQTRKKLQELRKQHWERELSQQSAWQQGTRRRLESQDRDSGAGTPRRLTLRK
ncbi:hypothetical protein BIW11_03287, partial [Tropilaelaps mercedesae]